MIGESVLMVVSESTMERSQLVIVTEFSVDPPEMVTWEIDPVGKEAGLQAVMELLSIVTGPREISHDAVFMTEGGRK
jgi:hypothetical protein